MTDSSGDDKPRQRERDMIKRVKDDQPGTVPVADRIHTCQLAERFLDRLDMDDAEARPYLAVPVAWRWQRKGEKGWNHVDTPLADVLLSRYEITQEPLYAAAPLSPLAPTRDCPITLSQCAKAYMAGGCTPSCCVIEHRLKGQAEIAARSHTATKDERSLPQREGEWKGPYVQPNSSGSLPSSTVAPKACPYCTSENAGVRSTYYDQTCEGCVKRMGALARSATGDKGK